LAPPANNLNFVEYACIFVQLILFPVLGFGQTMGSQPFK